MSKGILIRIQGKIHGPYSPRRTKAGARQGQFRLEDEISLDEGRTWVRIARTNLGLMVTEAELAKALKAPEDTPKDAPENPPEYGPDGEGL